MNHYVLIAAGCFILIVSYAFSLAERKTRIPSVLILLITGVMARQIGALLSIDITIPLSYLKLLGTIGLVLIVLEGTFELKLDRRNTGVLMQPLLTSICGIILTSTGLLTVIHRFYGCNLYLSLLYSLTFSIISSAVVIPSVVCLPQQKREFIIYESIFSDIIGILLFNLLVSTEGFSFHSIPAMLHTLMLTLIASVVISNFLLLAITKSEENNRFVFVLATLLLVYCVSKLFHLSSLLVIFVFGLIINNPDFIFKRMFGIIQVERAGLALRGFKKTVSELTFISKSLFFVVFGAFLNPELLTTKTSLYISMELLAIVYLGRYLILKLLVGKNIYPEVCISPRGLVSVLLFYSIPANLYTTDLESVLFLMVFGTGIFLTAGLIFGGTARDIG